VRDIRFFFDPESAYGMRRGFVDGFAVVANCKTNCYRRSPLWKKGVVDGITMLPRKDFRKLPVRFDTGSGRIRETKSGDILQQSKLGVGQFVTVVQALKQSSAGSSFFNKVFSKLHVPSAIKIPDGTAVAVVDLHGYDSFAAEASFNMGINSSVIGCAQVCHSLELHKHCRNLIGKHIHNSARRGEFPMAGFPKFDALIAALSSQSTTPSLTLSVCTVLPCGALVINDALVAKWLASEWTKEVIRDVAKNTGRQYDKGK